MSAVCKSKLCRINALRKIINFNNPWFWVPSVFFMEGFPGTIIMISLGIMYKNFGISNAEITFYTGILVLPWVVKPLWASLIDIFFTKKQWIYITEVLIGCLLIIMAIAIKSPNFFIFSLLVASMIAFISASHDIAVDGFYIMELKPAEQSFFVGLQSASYNVGKIFASGFLVMLCGVIYGYVGNYFSAWSFCLAVFGVICIFIGVYHKSALPKDETIKDNYALKDIIKDFVNIYVSFFKIKGLVLGLLFIFFFKLSESMVSAILPLFLIDSTSKGGLALSNTFVGFAYGTISPLAIVIGGLLGGYIIYKKGFYACIYWMLALVNIPNILYVLLAYFHISDHSVVLSCIAVEQFCFSVGYTSCIMFNYFMLKNSEYKTAHYSFFAGAMLFATMFPKILSGVLQEFVGYQGFFVIVFFMLFPAIFITKLIRSNVGDYGKVGRKAI